MLSRYLRTHLIVAPSTSIGKSIFSTTLIRASLLRAEQTSYLKPIGTGSGDGDDQHHIDLFTKGKGLFDSRCLFHFDEPVSPHLAVERAGTTVTSDHELVGKVREVVVHLAGLADKDKRRSTLYIESAGGVHSPTLAGNSQLDAYRPLRPPVILVASSQLGGISTTISAYESLLLRGYDVDSVLVFREETYQNYSYFRRYFHEEKGIHVGVIDSPPPLLSDSGEDRRSMERFYKRMAEGGEMQTVVQQLQERHERRIDDLESAPRRVLDTAWWPFVQHGLVKGEDDVMVIDSAYGDFYSILKPGDSNAPALPPPPPPPTTTPTPTNNNTLLLQPMHDGSASWWTQCLGHGHPSLTLAASYASGRYGHIMFPTSTSLPSLRLSETLLSLVGQSWASRVFFSDDGTTGMELALKMGLRAFAGREGLNKRQGRELRVLGLRGSYHGDTMGAMDACEENVYNDKVDWHRGRGYWFDPPVVRIEAGKPVVTEVGGRRVQFNDLTEVYDVDGRIERGDGLIKVYRDRIQREVQRQVDEGVQFGTLILEPVVMGAGGMIFVDPLFQRVLIDEVRTNRHLFPSSSSRSPVVPSPTSSSTTPHNPNWQGLPIIFDEVFVGLYRLGRPTSSTFLGKHTKPDIACYAKILTGGLVPMAVTLASDAVFKAFWGKKKSEALLHGHSYTAHPIGCEIGNRTLEILQGMEKRGEWDSAVRDWTPPRSKSVLESPKTTAKTTTTTTPSTTTASNNPSTTRAVTPVWSFWSSSFVSQVSHHSSVEGIMAIGTVLAIHFLASDGSGYESTASEDFLKRLRYGTPFEGQVGVSPAGASWNAHARPLGNVVYWMASLNTGEGTRRALEGAILEALGESKSVAE
ncbi:PLP-dependent transferase [Meredithblackwellia eburnea MCA 4105]